MKTFVKIIVILLVLFTTIYFGANYALKKIAVKTVSMLRPKLEERGIIVNDFDYRNVRLSSWNQCVASDIQLNFQLNKEMFGKESFSASFQAKALKIRFANLKRPSVYLELVDFSLYIEPDEKKASKQFGKLENASLAGRLPVYLKNPVESAHEIIAEIKILFKESKSSLDVDIASDVYLGIDDRELKVRLFTIHENDSTFLRFDPQDILTAAHSLGLEMATEVAEVIAKHPGKSPNMIKITRDAKRLSREEREKDEAFPEDAYKHVYWSYHLTREFGPELAQEITDAHEKKPGNTREERLMDFHNNEVARNWARQPISDDDLRSLVLTAPDIIRDPSEIR